MDDTTIEQLSRYLDGDLDQAEAELLERRLAAEPELAAELAALQRLQQQVRAVAGRIEPPAELDVTLLPLQRGAPAPAARMHPAVRWLGLAAGLALAVTVAVEVARRPPQPPPGSAHRPPTPAQQQQPSEFFQLKPLPTAATPEEERPLGAADRLLASPLAEAPLPEPEPLDVHGPLNEQEAVGATGAVRDRANSSPSSARASSTEESDNAVDKGQRAAPGKAARASAESAARPVAAPAAAQLNDEATSAVAAGRAAETKKVARAGRLVLTGEDGTRVAELELPPTAAATSSPLVITVIDGVIAGVEAEHEGAVAVDTLTSIRDAVAGRTVPGLKDGRYRGTVEASADPHHPQ